MEHTYNMRKNCQTEETCLFPLCDPNSVYRFLGTIPTLDKLEIDLGGTNICLRGIPPEKSESSKEIRNYVTSNSTEKEN